MILGGPNVPKVRPAGPNLLASLELLIGPLPKVAPQYTTDDDDRRIDRAIDKRDS